MNTESGKSFGFARERGVVWVCDIANSASFLNDNTTAEQIETYLPRLHWVGAQIVQGLGGKFKWTGDGFLAWFPVTLHRGLEDLVPAIFHDIQFLTILNNVSRLALPEGSKKFRLRHGVAIEHDGLVMSIDNGSHTSVDVIGRSVVLAFRLSGIRTAFPNVVVTREVLDAARAHSSCPIKFAKLKVSKQERDKYFKGEKWGTQALFHSVDHPPRKRSLKRTISSTERVIKVVENVEEEDSSYMKSGTAFAHAVLNGPPWAREAMRQYCEWGLRCTRRIEDWLEGNAGTEREDA